MEISRRQTVLGLTALGISVNGLPGALAGEGQHFAAVRRDGKGNYFAVIFNIENGYLNSVRLPARGHDIAVRPESHECVVFARRPGKFAIAFSAKSRRQPVHFSSRPDRHFFGHGVFSHDGKLLFTTENDFENAKGVIGIRDATDGYRQIGEFSSGGIGPHEIALLSDGRTLVVANGGIETHPESGRQPLNLDTMSPSLSYIDIKSGDTVETRNLSSTLHKLSIRHLTIAAGDLVVFGCQNKGPSWKHPPLVGTHRRGGDMRLIHLPKNITRAMQNYIASIEADVDGEIIMASAPRGGMAVAVDLSRHRYLGKCLLADVSGIAPSKSNSSFILTTGNGIIADYHRAQADDQPHILRNNNDDRWDNHLIGF